MAIPIINTTTSILEYRQWQYFEYQPFATETPTAWACPNLPAGLSVDSDTGKISGAATTAGVFICALVATNGTGDSLPLVLTLGVTESTEIVTNSGIELEIDVITRAVKLVGGEKVFSRQNDNLVLWLRFKKGVSVLDLDITGLEIALKEYEPDVRLVLGSEFKKFGSGAGAYYGLLAKLEGEALVGSFGNYESDQGTEFSALAEIGWIETNPETATFGPPSFQFSTMDFPVVIARDMGTVV